MNTRDFINGHIGCDVYVTTYGDLYFESDLRSIISYNYYKKVKLIKMTRQGNAYIQNKKGFFYSVPPKNIRLWRDEAMINSNRKTLWEDLIIQDKFFVNSKGKWCFVVDLFKNKLIEKETNDDIIKAGDRIKHENKTYDVIKVESFRSVMASFPFRKDIGVLVDEVNND